MDCEGRRPFVDVSKRCFDSRPLTIHTACARGYKGELKRLIAQGADVNVLDKLGNTPLHLAVREGHEDIVRMLLEAGADMNIANADNETPLKWANYFDDKEIIGMLMDE